MEIEQFDIWLADLNPRIGTEAGKIRPVLSLQTNLLNRASHPSTIVCPLTTKIHDKVSILRVHLKKGTAGLEKNSDIMIDQLRAVDNARLVKRLGSLPLSIQKKVKENLVIILDL